MRRWPANLVLSKKTARPSGEPQLVWTHRLIAFVTLVIFALDLAIPIGFGEGMAYVAVVLLAVSLPTSSAAILWACGLSVLVILGAFLSPPGGQPWQVVAHRGLTILMIWAAAGLGLRLKRQLQGMFHLTVDEAPNALIMADQQGNIARVNAQAERLFGYTREELLGRQIELLVPERFRAIHPEHRGRFLAAPRARPMGGGRDLYGLRKDGSEVPIEIGLTPLRRFDGLFVLSSIVDLTERKRMQEELDRRHRVAEHQEAELERRTQELLVANISHEIRSPMTAILGYTELLSEGKLSKHERDEYVDTIRSNGEYLLRIINDILDLSKIEAGKLTVERVPCSPAQLAAQVASLMRGRAAGRGLAFHVDYRGPLPEWIYSDPTRVRQILVNLMSNAIKFTEAGGVRLEVGMAGTPDQPRLDFAVTDSGIGLTPDQQSRLFKPFSQADTSTTRSYGGTGLGLAISKRLAEALGGEIRVQSAHGEGSTFLLSIPTEPLAQLTLKSPETIRIPVQGTSRASGHLPRLRGRVLLAEDAPDNQRLVSLYLRRAGAQVTVAENGRRAYEIVTAAQARGEAFDLVLMDMQMPELDGYAATAELRSASYRGPIVALTAHAMQGDYEKCLAAGCDDFVTKPIDRKALLLLVHKYTRVDRRRGMRKAAETLPGGTVGDANEDVELAALTETFLAGLPRRATLLDASLEQGHWETLAAEAHQLKGTAGAYGFPEIMDAAAELSSSLRAGSPPDQTRERARRVVDLCRQAHLGTARHQRLTWPLVRSEGSTEDGG